MSVDRMLSAKEWAKKIDLKNSKDPFHPTSNKRGLSKEKILIYPCCKINWAH
jgi:hypothetical protein